MKRDQKINVGSFSVIYEAGPSFVPLPFIILKVFWVELLLVETLCRKTYLILEFVDHLSQFIGRFPFPLVPQ